MPKCDFNKVALHIFRTTFVKKASERLLLKPKTSVAMKSAELTYMTSSDQTDRKIFLKS